MLTFTDHSSSGTRSTEVAASSLGSGARSSAQRPGSRCSVSTSRARRRLVRGHLGRGAQDGRAAVAHARLERRARVDEPVEVGHADADRRPRRERPHQPAPGRAVQQQVVAVAGAGHRQHERLAVDLDGDRGVQGPVEDRVQLGDVAGPASRAGGVRRCAGRVGPLAPAVPRTWPDHAPAIRQSSSDRCRVITPARLPRSRDDRHSRGHVRVLHGTQVRLEPRRLRDAQQRRRDRRGGPGLPAGARGAGRQLRQPDLHGVVEGGRRPGRRPGPRLRGGRAPAHRRPAVVPVGPLRLPGRADAQQHRPGPPRVLPAGAGRLREGLRAGRPGDVAGRGPVRGHHAAGVLLQREQGRRAGARA